MLCSSYGGGFRSRGGRAELVSFEVSVRMSLAVVNGTPGFTDTS